ncbi:MAG TPA: CU044_2847 family protein [Micromonosporaceae bacterium]|nr:CU044_2847 family protein [Micromonosporaceae bacterium]
MVEVLPARATSGDLSRRPPGPEPLRERVDDLADTLVEVAERLRSRLDRLPADAPASWALHQVQVQFGVALRAQTGVLVVTAGAESTFSATVTWTPKDSR